MRKLLFGCAGLLLAGLGAAGAEDPPATDAQPELPTAAVQLPDTSSAPASELLDAAGAHPAACAPACDFRAPCGPPGRIWGSAEYLLWWLRGGSTPPLLTTGPVVPGGIPGILGAPGTTVLAGDNRNDNNPYQGFRVTGGFWLDNCQTQGIEASYFQLFSRSEDTTVSTNGFPVLARPFIDVVGGPGVAPGAPNVELAGAPGVATGLVHVHQGTGLQGAQLNYLCNWCCNCVGRTDVIGGFSYLQLRDNLTIEENVLVDPNAPRLAGSRILVTDNFSTRNSFYGGQLGLRREVWRDRFFVNGTGLLGLGATHQVVDINGSTTIIAPNGTTRTEQGGLLALSSNIGHYSRDVFSVVPAVNMNVGVQVNNNLRVFMGYTFLYWSNVVRPGDQIDPVLNRNLIPTSNTFGTPGGPARPAFSFNDSGFWGQGLNVGVALRF